MITWTLCDNADAVARTACTRIVRAARDAIFNRGRFVIVLAGGSTPELCYRLLAESTSNLRKWHIFFGDERCLPPTDPQRNSMLVAAALFDRVSIPEEQIHIIPAELGAEPAARSYAKRISRATPFDMVLLGLGEDGHTASLFPGHNHPERPLVVPVHTAPKPPADRVSMNYSTLSFSRQVMFMVTGENKQNAVTGWRRGDLLPAARIGSLGGLEVLVDRAAWSG